MGVFVMPKKISWTTVLEDMEVGDILKVSIDVGRKTVAPRISREIKYKHPERDYSTDCTSEPGLMIISRGEDIKVEA